MKRAPGRIVTGDRETDRALDEVRRSIQEILADPFINSRLIEDVELPDATQVVIQHGLGRKYKLVLLSPVVGPSTSGRIEEIASSDPRAEVVLMATGFGATVTVKVLVA